MRPRDRPEVPDRALGDEEIGAQVEGERRVPGLGGHVLDPLSDHDAGGIDDDIEPAKLCSRLVGEAASGGGVPQVSLKEDGATAAAPHVARGGLSALARAVIVKGEIAAGVCEPERNRLSHPAAGSGHKRPPAGQVHGARRPRP